MKTKRLDDDLNQKPAIEPKIGEEEKKPEQLIFRIQKKTLAVVLAVLVLCSTLAVATAFFWEKNSLQEEKITVKVTPTIEVVPTEMVIELLSTPAPSSRPRIVKILSLGEPIWKEVATEIAVIPVFQSSTGGDVGDFDVSKAKCKEAAVFKDGSRLIYCHIIELGMGEIDRIMKFVKTADNQYFYVKEEVFPEDIVEKLLLPEVGVAKNKISGIETPEKIIAEGRVFEKGRVLDMYLDSIKNPQKLMDTPQGTIYQTRNKVLMPSGVYGRNLYLEPKDHVLVSYSLKLDFLPDDRIPQITWSDGTKNTNIFDGIRSGGCGFEAGDSSVIQDGSIYLFPKEEIGKTNYGEPVYKMTDLNNELLKTIYDQLYVPSRNEPLSLVEYNKKKPYFLYKDKIGDWQIFINDEYGILAECGKPVIYLYPTQKTEVNVKVGAIIRKSEPGYTVNGWKVTAYPDGKLITNGQTYDSLFWEGLGKGFYPDLENYGFIVPQKELLPTLAKHLSLLGLNQKESSDFLEFWLPKMPITPYVRLSWLGTKEMNALAPLYVSPKPDTEIRIFLDFGGLGKPVSLIPQKLSSPKRLGFTLVEWGGLLVGGHE